MYGGEVDPLPMMEMFDRGIQLRMGQAHVKRWIEEIMPLVCADDDLLGVLDLTTHRLPLEDAARGYQMFRRQQDNCMKVVLHPLISDDRERDEAMGNAALPAPRTDIASPAINLLTTASIPPVVTNT